MKGDAHIQTQAKTRAKERGRLIDAHTIRFERILPGSPELVWSYLTKRELLCTWLVDSDIPAQAGAQLRLSQNSDRVPIRVSGEIHGRVTLAEPPRLLAFTWRVVPEAQLHKDAPPRPGDREAIAPTDVDRRAENETRSTDESEVIFELKKLPASGKNQDRVLLTLTHRRVPAAYIPQTGAGWHAHLEYLQTEIRSDAGQSETDAIKGAGRNHSNFFALYEECLPLYVRALLQLTGSSGTNAGRTGAR